MIRIAHFEEYEPQFLKALQRHLYTSFGIGCEYIGQVDWPLGNEEPVDGHLLLSSAPKVDGLPKDRTLYLTQRKLQPRKLLTGELPTLGLSHYKSMRALLSLPPNEEIEPLQKQIFRLAISELGHNFGLHHCLDPRCAMYPPWTLPPSSAEATFCSFCRTLSERLIRTQKV
ncbi:MAG: hypothetical protein FWC28_03485 [Proteobacteria bacterium]|nr:hypothetical protein [Cystobacterineae bacterium]MCL2258746.1 hypothetical protein [Cystobacterineae bacterium]MCL2314302.1 hypothetical protein [Pseudomonadota bacterium]